MEFNDFSKETPWAIDRGAMDAMLAMMPKVISAEKMAGASIFSQPALDQPKLQIVRDVAVISLSGYISKRYTFLSSLLSGGDGSMVRFQSELTAAIGNPQVKGVVVYIDSPGGAVPMVSETAAALHRAAKVKPVVAYSDGRLLSAAYWIGSAATNVIIGPTTYAGSIGVLTLHADFSKMDEKAGVKYTYITAGKYKAEGNDAEPLSDAARRRIESLLADIYAVFLADVAAYRNADPDRVRSDMAEGRVFIGQRAVDVGLADAVGSLDDAIDLAAGHDAGSTNHNVNVKETSMPDEITTIEQIQSAYPDLCRQIADQAVAGVDTSGPVAAETDRILALAKIHFGDEAAGKFSAIVAGGISADQYRAMADALAPAEAGADDGAADPDKNFKNQMLDNLGNASAPDVGAGGDNGPQTFLAAVSAIMEADKCTKSQAMAKAASKYPDLHAAYITEVNQARR